jgi:hypothetical protein
MENKRFNLSKKINMDCNLNPKQWIEIYYIKKFISELKEELKTNIEIHNSCSLKARQINLLEID